MVLKYRAGLPLAALGWIQYRSSSNSRLDGCRSTLGKSIAGALDMYQEEYGELPDSLDELTPADLKFIPSCPAAGRDTYSAGYHPVSFPGTGKPGYQIACTGHNHCELPPNYPAYDSSQGLVQP